MADGYRCTSIGELHFLIDGLTNGSESDDVLELYHEIERMQREMNEARSRARARITAWLRHPGNPREIELEGTSPPKRLVTKKVMDTGINDKRALLIDALDRSARLDPDVDIDPVDDSDPIRVYNVQIMKRLVAAEPLLKSECEKAFGVGFIATHFLRAEVLDEDGANVFSIASVPARKERKA